MRSIIIAGLFSALVFALGGGVLTAGEDIKVERVSFERGKNSAIIESSITGYAVVDYVLGARQGQYMNVSMATNNAANYFNILAPGESQVALFNGSINENQYEGILPESGDYTVRVYMMRSAARRNETANYRLEMIITAADTQPAAPPLSEPAPASAPDAKVEGTPYHATGQVPCSMGDAPQGSAQCDFGVVRGKPGNAQVHVTPPGGFERVLKFIGGKVSSDTDGSVKAVKSGDLWLSADGVIGPKTRAVMNVPVAERIEQLELNLERWRWHDKELGDTYILVNIAGFDLKAVRQNRLELEMGVIVGKLHHETPVFSDRIRYTEFNPFWNLTPHIARTETLSHLRKNPGYLAVFLLNGQNGSWDRARVGNIVKGGKRTIVSLAEKVPVHLAYLTVWHDEEGVLHFNEDLYGRDDKLRAALKTGV